MIPLVNRNAGSSYSRIPRPARAVLSRRLDLDDLDAAPHAVRIAIRGAYSAITIGVATIFGSRSVTGLAIA